MNCLDGFPFPFVSVTGIIRQPASREKMSSAFHYASSIRLENARGTEGGPPGRGQRDGRMATTVQIVLRRSCRYREILACVQNGGQPKNWHHPRTGKRNVEGKEGEEGAIESEVKTSERTGAGVLSKSVRSLIRVPAAQVVQKGHFFLLVQ